MAREPVSKATQRYDEHAFEATEDSAKDWNDQPIDCRYCPFPARNGVHKTRQELVADLPPAPAEDVSSRWIGED